jgi:hypothetical protein
MVTPPYFVGVSYGYRGAGAVERGWNWTVDGILGCWRYYGSTRVPRYMDLWAKQTSPAIICAEHIAYKQAQIYLSSVSVSM